MSTTLSHGLTVLLNKLINLPLISTHIPCILIFFSAYGCKCGANILIYIAAYPKVYFQINEIWDMTLTSKHRWLGLWNQIAKYNLNLESYFCQLIDDQLRYFEQYLSKNDRSSDMANPVYIWLLQGILKRDLTPINLPTHSSTQTLTKLFLIKPVQTGLAWHLN